MHPVERHHISTGFKQLCLALHGKSGISSLSQPAAQAWPPSQCPALLRRCWLCSWELQRMESCPEKAGGSGIFLAVFSGSSHVPGTGLAVQAGREGRLPPRQAILPSLPLVLRPTQPSHGTNIQGQMEFPTPTAHLCKNMLKPVS